MPSEPKNGRDALSGWSVELLRFTVFIDPKYAIKVKTLDPWWRNAVGVDPETSIRKTRIDESVDSGPFDGGILALQIQAGGSRIDWFLGDAPVSTNKPKSTRYIDRLPAFRKLIEGWLGSCKAIKRIAFGPIVSLEFRDSADVCQMLEKHIHISFDPIKTSDVSYLVNRRRDSAFISSIYMNRVAAWELRSTAFVPVESLMSGEWSPSDSNIEVKRSMRLVLDVSTQETIEGTLTRDKIHQLSGELIELAEEIMLKGDVR